MQLNFMNDLGIPSFQNPFMMLISCMFRWKNHYRQLLDVKTACYEQAVFVSLKLICCFISPLLLVVQFVPINLVVVPIYLDIFPKNNIQVASSKVMQVIIYVYL